MLLYWTFIFSSSLSQLDGLAKSHNLCLHSGHTPCSPCKSAFQLVDPWLIFSYIASLRRCFCYIYKILSVDLGYLSLLTYHKNKVTLHILPPDAYLIKSLLLHLE